MHARALTTPLPHPSDRAPASRHCSQTGFQFTAMQHDDQGSPALGHGDVVNRQRDAVQIAATGFASLKFLQLGQRHLEDAYIEVYGGYGTRLLRL